MCRLYSRRLSVLRPQLDAANVRFVGVGLEELGVEEFIAGKYFDGELFIDLNKQAYNDLGAKRLGFFKAIGSILSKKGREFLNLAKKEKIEGNMKGDGFQNGGSIIITQQGEVLLKFIQDDPSDHVSPEEVLKALGIDEKPPAKEGAAAGKPKPTVVCDDDVCKIQK